MIRTEQTTLTCLILLVAVPLFAGPDISDSGPALGVARVSVVKGDVTTTRGDSGDWIATVVNMPIVEGDSIQTTGDSRAEIQLDYGNYIRLGSDTEVQLLELGSQKFRVFIVHGTAIYGELPGSEADVDIEMQLAAMRPMKSGRYRIEVGPQEMKVMARLGEAEVAFQENQEKLPQGKMISAYEGTNGVVYAIYDLPPKDEFDKWVEQRDKYLRRTQSYKYLSRDIYGADTLDHHGSWRMVLGVGYTWFPVVTTGWAPYRDGRWIWLDYYGWSWVSYEPWGWAPYHWGRWYEHRIHGWGWFPGSPRLRHVWRPALVTFIGYNPTPGIHIRTGFGYGSIGWCPLAPGELYHPWYGKNYYGSRGRNVRVVDNRVNIYRSYQNARTRNGITLVNSGRFTNGTHSKLHPQRLKEFNRAVAIRGPVPIAPDRASQGQVLRLREQMEGSTYPGSLRKSSPATLRDGTVRVSFNTQQQNIRGWLRDSRSATSATITNPIAVSRGRSGTSRQRSPEIAIPANPVRNQLPDARSGVNAGTLNRSQTPAVATGTPRRQPALNTGATALPQTRQSVNGNRRPGSAQSGVSPAQTSSPTSSPSQGISARLGTSQQRSDSIRRSSPTVSGTVSVPTAPAPTTGRRSSPGSPGISSSSTESQQTGKKPSPMIYRPSAAVNRSSSSRTTIPRSATSSRSGSSSSGSTVSRTRNPGSTSTLSVPRSSSTSTRRSSPGSSASTGSGAGSRPTFSQPSTRGSRPSSTTSRPSSRSMSYPSSRSGSSSGGSTASRSSSRGSVRTLSVPRSSSTSTRRSSPGSSAGRSSGAGSRPTFSQPSTRGSRPSSTTNRPSSRSMSYPSSRSGSSSGGSTASRSSSRGSVRTLSVPRSSSTSTRRSSPGSSAGRSSGAGSRPTFSQPSTRGSRPSSTTNRPSSRSMSYPSSRSGSSSGGSTASRSSSRGSVRTLSVPRSSSTSTRRSSPGSSAGRSSGAGSRPTFSQPSTRGSRPSSTTNRPSSRSMSYPSSRSGSSSAGSTASRSSSRGSVRTLSVPRSSSSSSSSRSSRSSSSSGSASSRSSSPRSSPGR